MTDHSTSSRADSSADRGSVDAAAQADRDAVARDVGHDGGPQDPDDMAAADGLTADGAVADSYGDMLERGAHQRGEGRVP